MPTLRRFITVQCATLGLWPSYRSVGLQVVQYASMLLSCPERASSPVNQYALSHNNITFVVLSGLQPECNKKNITAVNSDLCIFVFVIIWICGLICMHCQNYMSLSMQHGIQRKPTLFFLSLPCVPMFSCMHASAN